jgi:predicted kinase
MKYSNSRPLFIMLIGVPGSGKSFFVKNYVNYIFPDKEFTVVSSDAIIDQRAAAQGKTYSDVFQDEIKSATTEMNQNLRNAIANNMDIVWDQTNLTAKARAGKLSQIPKTYRKIAVFFPTPNEKELQRRLASRPGKNIPSNIVMGMKSQLQAPTTAEGFDEIISA